MMQFIKRMKDYLPDGKDIIRAILIMAVLFFSGYWFGMGFGVGLGTNYYPVNISVETSE